MSFTESLNCVYNELEGQEGICRIETGYIIMPKTQEKPFPRNLPVSIAILQAASSFFVSSFDNHASCWIFTHLRRCTQCSYSLDCISYGLIFIRHQLAKVVHFITRRKPKSCYRLQLLHRYNGSGNLPFRQFTWNWTFCIQRSIVFSTGLLPLLNKIHEAKLAFAADELI